MPVPVPQPGFARSVREGRPVRCDDPEPQAHEGVVDSIEAALPRPRVGAERGLAAYESHLDQRRKRLGQTRGRPTEAAGDFADPMCARPYRVEQRAQCRRRRDFLQQQPVGLAVQGSRRIQHQRVHRGVEIGAERLRKLPVTGHPAPQRVCGDQASRPVEWNRLAQISGLQGPHGEGLVRPAVQRRAGVEYRAVHHARAESATRPTESGQSVRRFLELHAFDAGRGRGLPHRLVQTRTGAGGRSRQPHQPSGPVRVSGIELLRIIPAAGSRADSQVLELDWCRRFTRGIPVREIEVGCSPGVPCVRHFPAR